MAELSNELKILLEANRTLAGTLDINQLLQVVLGLAAKVVQAETGSLLLLDTKTNELVFNVALGEAGSKLKEIRLKMGEGIAGWVAQNHQPAIVNDPASDPRWTRRGDNKTSFVTRSILCVPLTHQGKLLGVVQAINKMQGSFSDHDLMLLEAFAAQTAVAVENAKLFASVQSEKGKVETILNQMVQGTVLIDKHGDVEVFNPAAQRYLALQEPPVNDVWQHLKAFEITPSVEELQAFSKELIRFEAKRMGQKEGDVSLYLSGAVKRLFNEDGSLETVLVFMRDATLEKRQEKMKRDFLSLMSHKLKTPLIAITGYTPMLLEDEAIAAANPFIQKAVKSVHTQGMHLKLLVEKLIAFSLIEAEDLKPSPKPLKLADLIQTVLGSMKTWCEENKGKVIIEDSVTALGEVNLDYDQMKEVIKNLIENGIKFNKSEERQVRISAQLSAQQLTLSFVDNGVGIPAHEYERIFEKFYQIEESFTGQIEGAGLGLALVKKVVAVHNGAVQLSSKLGQGSAFTLNIPLNFPR